MQTWKEATAWEAAWHGNCVNTLGEDYKQIAYAKRMGLRQFHNGKSPFNFDTTGQSIVDIGGGPSSLLLKCVGFSQGVVVDPCKYPDWVYQRYASACITVVQQKAENFSSPFIFDMALIYNCLQHTENPEKIVANVRRMARTVHLFEWIETGVADGHLHNLTEADLNRWLGGIGKVEQLNENTARGLCYYGIFLGEPK